MAKEELLENPNAPIVVSYFGDLSEEQKKKVVATLPKGTKIVFRKEKVTKDDFDKPKTHAQVIAELKKTGISASYNTKPKKKAPATPKKKTTSRKKKR